MGAVNKSLLGKMPATKATNEPTFANSSFNISRAFDRLRDWMKELATPAELEAFRRWFHAPVFERSISPEAFGYFSADGDKIPAPSKADIATLDQMAERIPIDLLAEVLQVFSNVSEPWVNGWLSWLRGHGATAKSIQPTGGMKSVSARQEAQEKRLKIYRTLAGSPQSRIFVRFTDEIKAADGHLVAGKCSYASDGKGDNYVEIADIEVTPARDNSYAELIREAKTFAHELTHARRHSDHASYITEWARGSKSDRWQAERLLLRDEGEAERAEEKLFADWMKDGVLYWLTPEKVADPVEHYVRTGQSYGLRPAAKK